MPGSDEQPHPLAQLGDYRLVELISEGTVTRTYHAEQVSMARGVVLERIKESIDLAPEMVEGFLADVRAKAAVDHPGIGSVYEAIHEQNEVYYTRELLTGETFEDLYEEGRTFGAITMAAFLRQVASAIDYCHQHKIATLPLEPRHLVLGEHELVRLGNLAIAEDKPDPEMDELDRALVTELFLDLLQRDSPGATRISKLLGMMSSEEGPVVSWAQLAHTAGKLEQKFADEKEQLAPSRSPEIQSTPRGRPKIGLSLFGILLATGVVAAGAFYLVMRSQPAEARDLSAMIGIPAGSYQITGGSVLQIEEFWIDAHEVTIAEYAEFLDALESLPQGKRTGYDHPKQPPFKSDHLPKNWERMLKAAKSGAPLDGLQLDLNCPVTYVDWWDAHAFANWKGGRLPTLEEWQVASRSAQAPQPSPWGPVDQPGDVTDRGIHGLGGNVSEWTENLQMNPALPANPASPLACGGSFLFSGQAAGSRTWLTSRDIHMQNLGFRVVREAAP